MNQGRTDAVVPEVSDEVVRYLRIVDIEHGPGEVQ